jgi:hypothetical protein
MAQQKSVLFTAIEKGNLEDVEMLLTKNPEAINEVRFDCMLA